MSGYGALTGQCGAKWGTFPAVGRGVVVTRRGWFRVARLALGLSGSVAAECPASVPRAKKKGLAVKLNPCLSWLGDVDSNHG